MKIITLNTWGGRAGKEEMLAFFNAHKEDVDVFCLQEMWSDAYTHLGSYTAGGVDMTNVELMTHGVQDVSALLSKYQSFFHPHYLENYGLLTFVSQQYEVRSVGEVFVHKEKGYVPQGDAGKHARNVQYIECIYNGKPLFILNFHGLWNGQGKGDSKDRINQSEKIVEFLGSLQGEIVFCGDFNLLPDTQSIKIIEEAGMRNLVKEYGITSTRTSLYVKPEKFADYIFVSKGINVIDFNVLPDEISDHSPLLLQLE